MECSSLHTDRWNQRKNTVLERLKTSVSKSHETESFGKEEEERKKQKALEDERRRQKAIEDEKRRQKATEDEKKRQKTQEEDNKRRRPPERPRSAAQILPSVKQLLQTEEKRQIVKRESQDDFQDNSAIPKFDWKDKLK